jgi:hypothetical protein
MKTISILLPILFFCTSTTVIAQKKYDGIMFIKFDDKIEGTIKVNLDGPNDELIEVISTEKSPTKKGTKNSTSSNKINVAMIDYLLINGKKYYLRDIEIGFGDERYLRNVCVELIEGTLDCGIFQTGDGKKENSISVKLPREEYYNLASADFKFYANSSALPVYIGNCPVLLQKFTNDDPSVTWKDGAPREERIQKFKTIIKEYNECELKK